MSHFFRVQFLFDVSIWDFLVQLMSDKLKKKNVGFQEDHLILNPTNVTLLHSYLLRTRLITINRLPGHALHWNTIPESKQSIIYYHRTRCGEFARRFYSTRPAKRSRSRMTRTRCVLHFSVIVTVKTRNELTGSVMPTDEADSLPH